MSFLRVSYPNLVYWNSVGGQYKVPGTKYVADGFDPKSNTIFEFDGDYWHGNPKVYAKNKVNRVSKMSFGDLFLKTVMKRKHLESLGYRVQSIWESDWKRGKLACMLVQKQFRQSRKI